LSRTIKSAILSMACTKTGSAGFWILNIFNIIANQ
jgi:hypothetical protein